MLGALLSLLLLAERPHAPVVLMAEPVELREDTARRLQPSGSRALIHIGDLPRLDPLLRAGPQLEVLRLEPASWDRLQEAQALALVERSQCIVLSGGSWLAWWTLTHEVTRRNRFAQALLHAQRSGRGVVGMGAAAEYLAGQALVRRSELSRPRRNPRAEEELLAEGLGLIGNLALCTGRERREDFWDAARQAAHSRAVVLEGPLACILMPGTPDWSFEGSGLGVALDFGGRQRARARALVPDKRTGSLLPQSAQARWDPVGSEWELHFASELR